ncbi:MAG: hypothetical protein ACRC42_00490 [Mycoplasma sp.]
MTMKRSKGSITAGEIKDKLSKTIIKEQPIVKELQSLLLIKQCQLLFPCSSR